MFCSDSEVEEGEEVEEVKEVEEGKEGEENTKKKNFYLFLSKIIAKLSPPSNSVEEVRIEELVRMVNLLMEVATTVWKEAVVKWGEWRKIILILSRSQF